MTRINSVLMPFYTKAIIGPTIIMSILAYLLTLTTSATIMFPYIILFSLLGSTITVIGFHILLFKPIMKSSEILEKFSTRDVDKKLVSNKVKEYLMIEQALAVGIIQKASFTNILERHRGNNARYVSACLY